jgi:hypothetical protein
MGCPYLLERQVLGRFRRTLSRLHTRLVKRQVLRFLILVKGCGMKNLRRTAIGLSRRTHLTVLAAQILAQTLLDSLQKHGGRLSNRPQEM